MRVLTNILILQALPKKAQCKVVEKINSENEDNEDDNTNFTFTSAGRKNKRSFDCKLKLNNKKFKNSSCSSLQDLSSIRKKYNSNIKTGESSVSNLNCEKSKKKKKRSRNKNKSQFEEKTLNSNNEELYENNIEDDEFENGALDKTSTILDKSLTDKSSLLQNKNYQKLLAAKFRYLNEMLYKSPGQKALSYFQENADEFQDYHSGYQSQVSKWPVNPVDIIIQEIRSL